MMLPVRCNIATAASARDAHPESQRILLGNHAADGSLATRERQQMLCVLVKSVCPSPPFPPPILQPNGEKAKENNLMI